MELKVMKIIQENDNWKEILSKEPYCLKMNEKDGYTLLRYSLKKSDMTLPEVQDCRGLIVDDASRTPIALSFRKFFNYGEPNNTTEIDWSTARVQEKVDGTKIMVWYSKRMHKWYISTSGFVSSFDAPKLAEDESFEEYKGKTDHEISYGKLFIDALGGIDEFNKLTAHMVDFMVYTFELVGPEVELVVHYDEPAVYLIGESYFNGNDFLEVKPILKGMKKPKVYDLSSLEACIEATNKMGKDEEGFVVVDGNWNRVKIKSLGYLQNFYLRAQGRLTYARALKIIEDNEVDEYLAYFPDNKEIFDLIEKTSQNIISSFVTFLELAQNAYNECVDRKEYAETVKENVVEPYLKSLAFRITDGELNFKEIATDHWRKLNRYTRIELIEKFVKWSKEMEEEETEEWK